MLFIENVCECGDVEWCFALCGALLGIFVCVVRLSICEGVLVGCFVRSLYGGVFGGYVA